MQPEAHRPEYRDQPSPGGPPVAHQPSRYEQRPGEYQPRHQVPYPSFDRVDHAPHSEMHYTQPMHVSQPPGK